MILQILCHLQIHLLQKCYYDFLNISIICDSTVPSKLKASWFRQLSLKHELKGALSGIFLVSHLECADEWNPLNRATFKIEITTFVDHCTASFGHSIFLPELWVLPISSIMISRYNLGLLVGKISTEVFLLFFN